MKKFICGAMAALMLAGAYIPCNTGFTAYAEAENAAVEEAAERAAKFEEPAGKQEIRSEFASCKAVLVTDEGEAVFHGWDQEGMKWINQTLFTLDSAGKMLNSFALPGDISGEFEIRQSGEYLYVLYESVDTSGKAPKNGGVKLILLDRELRKKGEYDYRKFSKYAQYLDAGDNKIAYITSGRYLYTRGLDGGNKRLLFDGAEWEGEKLQLNTVAVSGRYVLFGAQSYIGSGEYYGIADTVSGEVTVTRNDKLYTSGIKKFGDVCVMSCNNSYGKNFTFDGQLYSQITSPRRIYIFKDGSVTELVTEADNEMNCIAVTPSGDIVTMESNIYKYGKKYGKDFVILRVYREGKCVRRIGVSFPDGYTGMFASDNSVYIGWSHLAKGHEGKSWTDMSARYEVSTVQFIMNN